MSEPRVQRQLIRVLRLAQALRATTDVRVLARRFRVCERTIRRDMQALTAAGYLEMR